MLKMSKYSENILFLINVFFLKNSTMNSAWQSKLHVFLLDF